MMNPSRSGRPGSYRPAQRDAKSRSMLNRFSKIDEDIVSRYDYDDEGSALSDLPPPYVSFISY
jgi:hypothetical protein